MNTSFRFDQIKGATGMRYGTPNERREARCMHSSINPTMTPYSPKVPPSNISEKRISPTVTDRFVDGITKFEIAVKDTMMTMAAEIKPASTAA
ncbi:hypothetical protein D3C76_1315870 [compost metagenome]